MKQFLKKWYRTQSIPEKHLINEIKSAISNEYIPFFIHVCVNYLLFFIAFFAVTVVIIPYLLFHYVQKILLFFILLFKHLNEENKKRNFKRNKEKHVKKTLSDYEKKLLKQNDLYYLIREYDKSIVLKKDFEKKCLEEFLYVFITHYNESCSTFSRHFFICGSGRRRSLGDMFLICKHYYPDCNIHEVLSTLIKMLQKKDIRGASYCNTINKYVFHNQSTVWNKRDNVEYSKEIIFQDLIDVYS